MIKEHKKVKGIRDEQERKKNFIKFINKKYKSYPYLCFSKHEIKQLNFEDLLNRLIIKSISAEAWAASIKIQKVF